MTKTDRGLPPVQPAQPVGIYVHVPFCDGGKCPYCDFYSVAADEDKKERYMAAVERELRKYTGSAAGRAVDTVYFGGGTPSLLGAGLARLLSCIKENYRVEKDAEITFEANPGGALDSKTLETLRKSGFNRLSLGMQSADEAELKALGRRHTKDDVASAVGRAHSAGFDNISFDLMLCVPGQTEASMRRSVDFAASLSPRHISAYLLKVEEGTRFFDIRRSLDLPDDDAQADMYLVACDALENYGFLQYEISNFAVKGFESRHNTRYWDCGEYLGFGPAAHSFFCGRRFYYPRGLEDYISGAAPVPDGDGGSFEEYVMLRLRLTEGLLEQPLMCRCGRGFSAFDAGVVSSLCRAGLLTLSPGRLALTRKGMLVSNSVISELIFHQKY